MDAEQEQQKAGHTFPTKREPLPEIPRGPRDYPTDHRHNKPHPYDCAFIRTNPKWMNEPISTVHTRTISRPSDYRPSASFFSDEKMPTKTEISVFMSDYSPKDGSLQRMTRFGCNPNKSAATGIVPGTELDACRRRDDRALEDISFEHMYDSRKDPNYPIRTKRHGSFVWKHPRPYVGSKLLPHLKRRLPERGSESGRE